MNFTIREMQPSDGQRILEIFQQGLDTHLASFETQAPSWESWDMNYHRVARLVLQGDEGKIIGWAALKPISTRACYSGVAEVSVYVDSLFQGKGLGTMLLRQLALASEEHQFWTLQSSIFPENEASIRMHQKAGFRLVGTRRKIAKLEETWRDVSLLERRSTVLL
ncbi:N-acetyltransferase family protein [Chryseobacterium sp. A301]